MAGSSKVAESAVPRTAQRQLVLFSDETGYKVFNSDRNEACKIFDL